MPFIFPYRASNIGAHMLGFIFSSRGIYLENYMVVIV